MALETCSDPLELEMTDCQRRMYVSAFDVCLGEVSGRYTEREVELHQGYLAKVFNDAHLAGYIMLRAYVDAQELRGIITTY